MSTKKVFVSYSVEDITYAKWLGNVLRTNGINVVLSDYTDYEISKAIADIDEADAFVALYSSKTKQIDNQSKETEHAFKTKKRIFSVIADKCTIEGQYNYYLSQGERFEIYKNKSKALRLLIGQIKQESVYGDIKIKNYHLDLLDEDDIDFIISGQKKKKKFPAQFSPFSRLYSKHPTVNFALKCFSAMCAIPLVMCLFVFIGNIYAFLTMLILEEDVSDIESMFFSVIGALGVLGIWNLAYFPSVFIAKLGVKSKFLTVVLSILTLYVATMFIEFLGRY